MRAELIEQLRWQKFPVTSDGFVTLVDVMGDDSSVTQAARVSYGKDVREGGLDGDAKSVAKDRDLIRYLMRHRHTTPLEMCEIKLLVRVPMDCWRQWIRHRTACLSGDTLLHFDLPGGVERRGNQLYKLSLSDIYERFQATQNATRPDKQKNPYFRRDRVQAMLLRCVDETSNSVGHTQIVDIWKSGVKTVYAVNVGGRIVKMSANHLCLTDAGWKQLHEFADLENTPNCQPTAMMSVIGPGTGTGFLTKPNEIDTESEEWIPIPEWEGWYEVSNQGRVRRIVGGKGSRSHGRCKKNTLSSGRYVVSLNRPGTQEVKHISVLMALAFLGNCPEPGFEVCHEDGNCLNNVVDNLRWGSPQSNADDRVRDGATTELHCRFEKITSIENVGLEMTYDIEVAGEYHNFSANGVVVHNSVNEYSTRYTEAIDSNQMTLGSEWRLQADANKQGSKEGEVHYPSGQGSSLDYEAASGIRYDPVVWPAGAVLTQEERNLHNYAAAVYKERLNFGVAKEQARKDLLLSTYTEAYWKCDLHNLLHFLGLRMDSHAQKEIRDYATTIGEKIVAPLFPLVWEAFVDYRLNAVTLSGPEIATLGEVLADASRNSYIAKSIVEQSSRLGQRERAEFTTKLKLMGVL